jgi:hypothetical protein
MPKEISEMSPFICKYVCMCMYDPTRCETGEWVLRSQSPGMWDVVR